MKNINPIITDRSFMVFMWQYSVRTKFEIALTDYLIPLLKETPDLSFPQIQKWILDFSEEYKGFKTNIRMRVCPAASIIGRPDIKPYEIELKAITKRGRFPFMTISSMIVNYSDNPVAEKGYGHADVIHYLNDQ